MLFTFLFFITVAFAEIPHKDRPENQYYDYASNDIMNPKTKRILNEKMWSFNYMNIPKETQRRIALMFVEIREGKVYQQCFGKCNGYYMMFAAMIYEF